MINQPFGFQYRSTRNFLVKFLNSKLFYRACLADLVQYSDSVVWSSRLL